MTRRGVTRPDGSATHHLVAGEATTAEKARSILKKFKIGINDPENGAFLPCNSNTPCNAPGPLHSKLHTERYYEAVNELLEAAKTREQAITILDRIRKALLASKFP